MEDSRKLVTVGLGVGALATLAYFLMRNAKAAPGPGGSTPSPCDNAPPDTLCVLPECVGVKYGEPWVTDVAAPAVVTTVGSSDELPIPGTPILNNDPEVLNASLDRVVRDALQEFLPDCYQKAYGQAFWLDLYMADNPLPQLTTNNRKTWYGQLTDYTKQVQAAANAASEKVGKSFRDLATDLGTLTLGAFMARFGLDPTYEPVEVSTPPGASSQDKNVLKGLQYDLSQETMDAFREDFDQVMDYLSEFGWSINALNLTAGDPGPEVRQVDREAMAFAAASSALSMVPWRAWVASAGGYALEGA